MYFRLMKTIAGCANFIEKVKLVMVAIFSWSLLMHSVPIYKILLSLK